MSITLDVVHPIDGVKLDGWLRTHVPNWTAIAHILQFRGGQSNPTYKIVPVSGQSLVLRKKPHGTLLKTAHLVEREYRVLKALERTSVPVPRVFGLCEDASVIGTTFYIMEFVEGRIFKDARLPSLRPDERTAIYQDMIRVLGVLHSVDWKAVGLDDFGREGNYYRRQLKTWGEGWERSKVEPNPAMEELIQWLGERMQPQVRTTIVHGDFRLENLMIHPTAPRIVAVLDWEISTIGDPRADLAYHVMPFYLPAFGEKSFGGVAEIVGVPKVDDYLQQYCIYTQSQSAGITSWGWHLAFAMFRLAAIAAGVYKRSLQGNASDGDAAKAYKDMPRVLAEAAVVLGKDMEHTVVGRLDSHAGGGANPANMRLSFDPRTSWFKHPANRSAYTNESLRETASLFPMISARALDVLCKINDFMNEHVFPAEEAYVREHFAHANPWTPNAVIERLKPLAKKQGLWNLFLPSLESSFTNLEYARMAEVMGQVAWSSEVFNCSAPDTGNMEILHRFGTPEQKARWLEPLLEGTIRSCFGMTEPDVASSDARNIQLTISKVGSNYVLNGRKWYISGAGDPRCKVCIVMGKMEGSDGAPEHMRQSMVLVPMDAPGVSVVRACGVFGADDSPHGHMEMVFKNVTVDAKSSILWDEGMGFAIAQARLGPGRIHHCMRSIGCAQRALYWMILRGSERNVFGGPILSRANARDVVAESRLEIEQCRLLTLHAAHMMDTIGNKAAAQHIAMIKIAAPRMACTVVDRAMQVHGAKGLSQDSWLPWAYAHQRTLRLADGPDEVHLMSLGKTVIAEHRKRFAKL